MTFDTDVSFHAISSTLALGAAPLRKEALGPALLEEGRVVVEVKHLGAELPDWLSALGADRAEHFSKFATGMKKRLSSGLSTTCHATGRFSDGRMVQ